MGMLKEFKEFAVKGNVVDMAVGIVIGSEFNKIVGSVVSDIVMPPVGMLISNVDFKDLYVDLSRSGSKSLAEAKAMGAATLNYGNFVTTTLSFVITAFSVFLMVKAINRFRRAHPEDAPQAAAPK